MFDKEKFGQLLEQAKGNRSINQFALQCNVSSAHISRLIRGLLDTPPNPETIKKFTSKSKNDISYIEMMKAAGYLKEDISSKKNVTYGNDKSCLDTLHDKNNIDLLYKIDKNVHLKSLVEVTSDFSDENIDKVIEFAKFIQSQIK